MKFLIVALMLSGCTSTYERVDEDDAWNDTIKTSVTETHEPYVSDETIKLIAILAAGLAAFEMAR